MSLSAVERRKTTIAQPNLPFYHNEKIMRTVGRALVILGILLAGATAAGGYFFHASPLYATNPNLFLVITIGGSALTIGSFAIALYLHEKVYWKDQDYCESLFEKATQHIAEVEFLKMLLRRSDLPKLSETAIDGTALTEIIQKWFESRLKLTQGKISQSLIQDFVLAFKWRPFEIGILEKGTLLCGGATTVGQVLIESYKQLRESNYLFENENKGNIQKYLET